MTGVAKRFKELSRIRGLVLDDYGLAVLESDERRELLEILEDRYQRPEVPQVTP